MSIIGSHSGNSGGTSWPLVAVTALGIAAGRRVLCGRAEVGDDRWVTKRLKIDGTAFLAGDFADAARAPGLAASDLAVAERLMRRINVLPEAPAKARHGATARHGIARGGLLATLLKIAYLWEVAVGLEAPCQRQQSIVVHLAMAFGFDPMRTSPCGTLAATALAAQHLAVVVALSELGASQPGGSILRMRCFSRKESEISVFAAPATSYHACTCPFVQWSSWNGLVP